MNTKSPEKRFVALVLFQFLFSVKAVRFNETTLLGEYSLVLGRTSACPSKVSYQEISLSEQQIPAPSTAADGHNCIGPGGKRVQNGTAILGHGLTLPSLLTQREVYFFGGVETATRVCGPWAFNASSISWFVGTWASESIMDHKLGITIEPEHVYLMYSHFTDFCVYRTKVEGRFEPPGGFEKTPELNDVPEEVVNARKCFPADAKVKLEDGSVVPMSELQVGDRVLSSPYGHYSDVFFFSHRDHTSSSEFIKLTATSGMILSLTAGHIIYLNGRPQYAFQARLGDVVTTDTGGHERVVDIETHQKTGLYNPQTLTGDIIVNNIYVTTWTTAISAVSATSFLSPHRLLYTVIPTKASAVLADVVLNAIDAIRDCAAFGGLNLASYKTFLAIGSGDWFD